MKYQKIIDQMTLEEKASLTSGKDFWQSQEIERLDVPSMFMSDGPHGIRKQAAAADHLGLNASIPATCYPTAVTMANTWDPKLGEEMGACLGTEAKAMNVNVLLGPGLNMKRSPLCGRNFEYFSEDPYLAGKMAASYARGIQSQGVASCVKHFAVNSQELRRMSIDEVVDERALREIYLTGFEIAVKEGKPKAIMSSYNSLNGTYTNENVHLLQEILRDEWGFDGAIITDWAGCNDRVLGLKAGNELEMPSCKASNLDVINAVKNGDLDEKVLDERIDTLLQLIFDTHHDTVGDNSFDVEQHHAMAQRCAEESIVLLKNEGVLPLTKNEKVVLIGDFAKNPRYQGAGSSVVNPTKLDDAADNMQGAGLNYVGYAQGFDRYGKKKPALVKEAISLANEADVVLYYMGLDEVTEAEGLDRENMKIHKSQIDLLHELKATGKKIVVILSCGSAVEMDWADDADAIVHTYLGGQASAKATLHVISGKVNPSGKLSESIPYRYEDSPVANYFPGTEVTSEHRESIFIGYRYYDTAEVPVRYPFGFGLSYTTYEYSDLAVTKDGVTFTVKNTGSVAGKEIAQVYVGCKDSKIFRARKELKGFEKIALAPGESKTVAIPFDDKTFRFFNVKTNAWEVEGATYQIMVGASSADIRLTAELEVEGTTKEFPYEGLSLPSYESGKVQNVPDEEFRAVLGREIPKTNYTFIKKNRMVIEPNSSVAQLRYARGWTGRVFAWAIRTAIAVLRGVGNRTTANTLVMGVLHQPMRGLQKFGNMTDGQINGLMTMFNGKFFKGFGMFLKK